jgi:hypothetical protein
VSLLDPLVTGISLNHRFLVVEEIIGGRKVMHICSGRLD